MPGGNKGNTHLKKPAAKSVDFQNRIYLLEKEEEG